MRSLFQGPGPRRGAESGRREIGRDRPRSPARGWRRGHGREPAPWGASIPRASRRAATKRPSTWTTPRAQCRPRDLPPDRWGGATRTPKPGEAFPDGPGREADLGALLTGGQLPPGPPTHRSPFTSSAIALTRGAGEAHLRNGVGRDFPDRGSQRETPMSDPTQREPSRPSCRWVELEVCPHGRPGRRQEETSPSFMRTSPVTVPIQSVPSPVWRRAWTQSSRSVLSVARVEDREAHAVESDQAFLSAEPEIPVAGL